MFLILPLVRVFQKFHYTHHVDCRILADGMRIWHLECHDCLTSITADNLDPITLGIASECVYTTFFWTLTSHTLHQLPEDVLFGHFVIALNAVFTQQLSLADEGYESGSNTADLPTPLQKTPCIHHMSSIEHASFGLAHTTPHCPATIPHPCSAWTPLRPVHHHLSFTSNSSEGDQDPDNTPEHSDEEEVSQQYL